MDITRDLFLSDGRAPYFTVTLTSRDLRAHQILTSLTADEYGQIEDALTAAAVAIAEALKGALAA
jgi:hypothetical protein